MKTMFMILFLQITLADFSCVIEVENKKGRAVYLDMSYKFDKKEAAHTLPRKMGTIFFGWFMRELA